ncbi:MAG TPA: SDR family NAD(P)-dependent oxidoreductase [Oligoflexus sp.]|uniref:SDR family oxidoreductase n=1 Tax=Oligoflexus sp. TaxID=1971216 RepID=UPI002D7F529E|nr:SDR family NAD(P)-dependent oxidoreductase [Oligoflexus sp.]HET9237717.1 SDR family NAD(P)-dependent oxidoreductase [Oligoflexus sp.]
MRLSGNTILITGGASGIGLGLATRLMSENRVILCGRNREKLTRAVHDYPQLEYIACDLSHPEERVQLARTVVQKYPELNILINNAGIQRRVPLTTNEEWDHTHEELAINLEAPIHLTRLLTAHLSLSPAAAVINVSSGLAFVPMAMMPIYCASKAALHSYTLSLRMALEKDGIEVIEIIPPAVNTDLGGKGLHDFGVPLAEFCDAAILGLREGRKEIAYGSSLRSSLASRQELDGIFEAMNRG